MTTLIKAKPHPDGVKLEIVLGKNALPEVLRPKYTERDLEMFRKGFVSGRIGTENLEQFEKKLTEDNS